MKTGNAKFVKSACSAKDLLAGDLPEIAFAGRSNVGKSSLLNRLVGQRKLARISSTPGRTRAINYFLMDDRYYFVDLPGYGYAKVGKSMRRSWAQLTEAYFKAASGRLRVVQLVDMKVGATPLDTDAFHYFSSVGATPVLVATKCDRVPKGKRRNVVSRIRQTLEMEQDEAIIPFSAETGEGVKQLWGEVGKHLQECLERSQ